MVLPSFQLTSSGRHIPRPSSGENGSAPLAPLRLFSPCLRDMTDVTDGRPPSYSQGPHNPQDKPCRRRQGRPKAKAKTAE